MDRRPHFLLSNDDGYDAKGLVALASNLSKLGEVDIVAPTVNYSGASSSLTLSKTVAIREIAPHIVAVEGTPADCVHLGLTGILKTLPDLIISGINEGPNLGEDICYSGTVGAAREGFIYGIKSLSFSQTQRGWAHLDAAVEIATQIILEALGNPNLLFLNVNIPSVPLDSIQGMAFTHLGRRQRPLPAQVSISPRGHKSYWIGAAGLPLESNDSNCDFDAIKCNKVSITPLGVDVTDYNAIHSLKNSFFKVK